jgi:hypothetical protein
MFGIKQVDDTTHAVNDTAPRINTGELLLHV